MTTLIIGLIAGVAITLVALQALASMRNDPPSFDQHTKLAIYCALIRTGGNDADANGRGYQMHNAIILAKDFQAAIEAERKEPTP